MTHGPSHVVALLGVYRHGHRRPAPHFGLEPSLLLVVEEKRHQRLKRKRRVEQGTRKEEIFKNGIVIPKPGEQLAPALRGEYFLYLRLGAYLDKALAQDRAPDRRTRLQVSRLDVAGTHNTRHLPSYPFPVPRYQFPVPRYQLLRLQVDDAVAPCADPAQGILRRLGDVHAKVLQESVRRPAPERRRVRVVDGLKALDAPLLVRSEVMPQEREFGHVDRLPLLEVSLVRRT